MIGFKAYRSTPTTLDLNGPILSYTTQPVGLTTDSSTINLVGIATALPVGTGSISYQWYETGYGPISTSSTITGTATTALSLTALNYNDNGRNADPEGMRLVNFWANIYNKGDYTKTHMHMPFYFSFVYFLKSKCYSNMG